MGRAKLALAVLFAGTFVLPAGTAMASTTYTYTRIDYPGSVMIDTICIARTGDIAGRYTGSGGSTFVGQLRASTPTSGHRACRSGSTGQPLVGRGHPASSSGSEETPVYKTGSFTASAPGVYVVNSSSSVTATLPAATAGCVSLRNSSVNTLIVSPNSTGDYVENPGSLGGWAAAGGSVQCTGPSCIAKFCNTSSTSPAHWDVVSTPGGSWSVGAPAQSFQFVNSSGCQTSSTSTNTCTAVLDSVDPGDLIVAWIAGRSSTPGTLSDGVSASEATATVSDTTRASGYIVYGNLAYILSAAQTAANSRVTYTITFGSAARWMSATLLHFRPAKTASVDKTMVSNQETSSTTAFRTGTCTIGASPALVVAGFLNHTGKPTFTEGELDGARAQWSYAGDTGQILEAAQLRAAWAPNAATATCSSADVGGMEIMSFK